MLTKRFSLFTLGGTGVGLVSLGFISACIYAEKTYQLNYSDLNLYLLILTPLTFILCMFLIKNFFPGAEGSGIPQVLLALASKKDFEHNRYLSWKIFCGKLLIIPIFLIGGSLGYEGPAVQIGAVFMAMYGRFFKVKESLLRALVLAGGGAGLAAAFGAPLTGIVFVIEELAKDYRGKITLYILTSIMVSGLICEAFLGHYIYLGYTLPNLYIRLLNPENYPAVILCGILGGLFGGLFSLILTSGTLLFSKIKPQYYYYFIFCLGLIVALANVLAGSFLAGSGQAETQALMLGQHVHAHYGLFKVIALLATYFTGLPCGLFTPSLTLGAVMGQFIVNEIPGLNVHFIILLSMVAFLSGVTQAPLTSFTIVMEATGQDSLLPVLIAVSLISSFVSALVMKKPLYEELGAIILLKTKSIPLSS